MMIELPQLPWSQMSLLQPAFAKFIRKILMYVLGVATNAVDVEPAKPDAPVKTAKLESANGSDKAD